MSTTRWCAAGVVVMLAAGLTPMAPLRDAVTLAPFSPASGVRLVTSPAFVALAPLNNILDALSLLSLRQHLALLTTVVAVYAAWRLARRRGGWLAELRAAGILVITLLVVYATGVLVPRPMAALAVQDPDAVIVDFHSHTSASHDGRRGFGPEANRAWHAAAGYTAAYVTDHFVFGGAERARAKNPPTAGGGTVVLGGVEVWNGDEHVVLLGTRPIDSTLLHGKALDMVALYGARMAGRRNPIVIETIPGHLATLPVGGVDDRVAPVQAIEISDAAPKGLDQIDREHGRILRLADSAGLAVVSASDNHGWGRTAAAWSLVEIPGWRTMTPDSLDGAIEQAIDTRGRGAVRVVERTRPTLGARSTAELAAIGPEFLWYLVATRSWPERLAWTAWLGVLIALSLWGRHAANSGSEH